MAGEHDQKQDLRGIARRTEVLESALRTFAKQGYRKTSMDDIARDARISRPGLYLYFPSKHALLQQAVSHALTSDIAAVEIVLEKDQQPLRDRLLDAFDLWAGQYTGQLATDLEGLLSQDAALLGDLPMLSRRRFREAVERAVSADSDPPWTGSLRSARVTDVLLALAAGTKHQAADRADFRTRFGYGLDLMLGVAPQP